MNLELEVEVGFMVRDNRSHLGRGELSSHRSGYWPVVELLDAK